MQCAATSAAPTPRSADPQTARVLLVGAADRVLPAFPESLSSKASRALEQLEFLIGFLRGNVAYQEERMRLLEELKAREASEARAAGTAAGAADAAEGAT